MNNLKSLLLFSLLPILSFGQLTELQVREMAQSSSEQELVIESSQLIQERYYFFAEILVDKLLVMKSESSNYNYRKGYLILDSRSDYEKAMPYLEKAILDMDKNYDMFSAREESAPQDALYYLAKSHHLNEDIPKAREFYTKFIENSAKKSSLIEMAQLGLKQLEVAEYNIAHPKTAEVRNIGNIVNTGKPEYSPVISLDGTSLYFTSRRQWDDKSSDQFRDPMLNDFPEDIFVSFQDFEGEWTAPMKLAFCDSELNEATIAVSSDERKIYVYQDISGGGDIFFSNFGNNEFEELEKLRAKKVNTNAWETHITVTPDGQNMYFVSDRSGGFGGRDIYRIVKLPNGEWSEPQNMGPGINTPYDEDSPFIAINNKTLYYSSNGPKSMGGFDVFVSFRDEMNVWSTPLNMGYPINSAGDDIYYTTTVDGLKGYLSSFRKGGFGEKDIYEIKNDYLGNRPISTLRGNFTKLDGSDCTNDFSVKIECLDCNLEADKVQYPRIKNCNYFAVLKRCKEYTVTYYEGEEVIGTESFNTKCNSENEEIKKVFYYGDYSLASSTADKNTLESIAGSKIEFLDPNDGSVLLSLVTDENGKVTTDYLKGKKFGDSAIFDVRITKEGYLTETFKVRELLGNTPGLKLDYLLTPSDVGTLIEINPIYFDLDKSNIRPDAAIELNKIVKIMNDNPKLKIELGSHTDCRASKSYNKSLSNRRAKSSAAYVRKRITNPKRIYGKGYGESQLVNDCGCEGNVVSDCSEEEHQANRRTEFKIIKN
ncbi:MAG: PD40 domain-containing protein [Fluviicola sp.]|nr:PD40 domain-containing protein [Fluviicola sp.]